MSVAKHDINSLFGFFIFITIAFQIISGIMLSFSLLPEPMLIPMVRDEEDLEDLYIDDFFWLHERGVDLIFIFSYFHLFRKIYLNVFNIENEAAWKSGVFSFLVFQVVVFCGLILCCSHLSEITLTIAANIMHTFFLFYGKFYWWFFTDKQLNTDTLLRLAYAHYLSAFYLAYLGLLHGIDMHYDWKNEASYDGIEMELV
jgi:quinol-cytochrome oxidoreductase complex cytochrome b subunit